ncbi:MAG: GntR family transcriptional regulator [Bacillota bacterium]
MIRPDSRPLYILVKEKIDEKIANGTYQPDEQLPSEAQLSEDLGVSRATLREALRVLEKEGKVNRRQGVGTFITKKAVLFKSGIEELNSITEMIEEMGLEAGTTDLELELGQRDQTLAKELEINPQENMAVINRTRTANGEAVAYCEDYLPQARLPNEIKEEDLGGSLFDFLQQNCEIYITYAVADVIPVLANSFLADKLEIDEETPLLLLKQMHYNDRDHPLLYSKNYFRSDKFEFHVVRNRN